MSTMRILGFLVVTAAAVGFVIYGPGKKASEVINVDSEAFKQMMPDVKPEILEDESEEQANQNEPVYTGPLYAVAQSKVGLRYSAGGSTFAYVNPGQEVLVLGEIPDNQRGWVEVRAGALSGWVNLSDFTILKD